MATVERSPYLLTAARIQDLSEQRFQHPLHTKAIRYTKSMSEGVGLQRLGLHLVRVEPGYATTQFHCHHQEEEFIYILSGQGIVVIGSSTYKVGSGDFMGFTAPSLPHSMLNPSTTNLVYLMGGARQPFDICDYPHLQQRLIRCGDQRHLYNWTEDNTHYLQCWP